MADTKVTVPFNKKYLPGENSTYTKISISAVLPGSATRIVTDKNHGLYGNADLITVYDNGTNPFLNFVEYPATVVDGRSFTIPIDTTKYTALCSNGYIVKRSSFVGPVRKLQDYNEVALSITPALDRYIEIEKQKNDFGIQTEVDISMLGIPREETTSTQIEEVTKYNLNPVYWQTRSWNTFGPIGDYGNWHLIDSIRNGDDEARFLAEEYYLPLVDPLITNGPRRYDYYRGSGQQFIASESCYEMYAEMPEISRPYFLGPVIDPYYPGKYPAGFAYHMLETQRSFKYLPGRANVFTFGVRVNVDNGRSIPDEEITTAYANAGTVLYEQPPGNITRWGVGNATDAYFFELSGNGARGNNSQVIFSVNRRRHYRGDKSLTVKPWGVETQYNGLRTFGEMLGYYPDDPFYCVSPDNTKISSIDPDAPELTKVFQKDFSVDTVDGKGPSGSILDFTKVTMYKIEFSWYGAAGARFFAYLNQGNARAEWVCLHEIEGGQLFKQPVLTSPVMQIKYMVFARAGARVSLKKYGVSAYIEGADEGTMVQNTRYADVLKDVGEDAVPLVGISTTDVIYSSFNEPIPNSKIVLPSLINVTASENCLIEVLWKPTSNLVQGITKGAELRPLQVEHPSITACVLANSPAAYYKYRDGHGDQSQAWTAADEAGFHALSGAYNFYALSGNFGITGPAAREALVGARIFENSYNYELGWFKGKVWNPYLSAWDPDPLNQDCDDNTNACDGLPGSNFYIVPKPGQTGISRPTGSVYNVGGIRTGIFNTYISAVGDFDPSKPALRWFDTCEKGDVIWLTRPLTSCGNKNLGTTQNAPIGTELGVTGPFPVYNDQWNQGPDSSENGRTPYGNAFTSIYAYATGCPLAFNLELLDRQAVSVETFTGKESYWISCNLGESHEGSIKQTKYTSLQPTCEGYIGRYYLRNYILQLTTLPSTHVPPLFTINANERFVGIKTCLPHLLSANEAFTYIHATDGLPSEYQGVVVPAREARYTILSSVSADYFITKMQDIAAPQGFDTSNVGSGRIYFIKDTVPEYIPLTNINFYPYPYIGNPNGTLIGTIEGGRDVGREPKFPDYGLPIDRPGLDPFGGPTLQIWPRGDSNTFVYPYYSPLESSQFQQKAGGNFIYWSRLGVASAAYTPMAIGFPQPYRKALDNVQKWSSDDTVPRGPLNRVIGVKTSKTRDKGEPWKLVFVGHKGASIRDAVIISDYYTKEQQTVGVNWKPLSSIRFGPTDFLTEKMLSGVPGLSCVYPRGSNALRQPPNFISYKDMYGTAAKLDFQGSQPIYYDNFIPATEAESNVQMAPRRIAAFYAPKGQVLQYDVSSYFGLVAEYLSNTLKKKELQPWNTVYITARTLVSARPSDADFKPDNFAGTGYNENGMLGLIDFNNRYGFTELKGRYQTMATGDKHAIFLDEFGKAYAVGDNTYGQCGRPGTTTVSYIAPIEGTYQKVVCGNNNTFLLSSNGVWWATGANDYGQLGIGIPGDITQFVELSTKYVKIVPGKNHTFAQTSDNQWWVTGDNSYGQLGTGSMGAGFIEFQRLNNFIFSESLTGFRDVACGDNHTLFLSSGSAALVRISRTANLFSYNIWGCGRNADGQLGLNNNTDISTITQISTGSSFYKIAARGNQTFALSSNRRYYGLWATGNNQYGQLGLNSYINYNTLQRVLITNSDLDVIPGTTHTAIISSNTIFTAGNNLSGQLGFRGQLGLSSSYEPALSSLNDYRSVLYPGYDASVSLTTNHDSKFHLTSGQSLPLSGASIFYQTLGLHLSAYLSELTTYTKRLIESPIYPYPTAKVYAGMTWREQ